MRRERSPRPRARSAAGRLRGRAGVRASVGTVCAPDSDQTTPMIRMLRSSSEASERTQASERAAGRTGRAEKVANGGRVRRARGKRGAPLQVGKEYLTSAGTFRAS
eukprot:222575-Chlamydomonas_euryale.AAC.8